MCILLKFGELFIPYASEDSVALIYRILKYHQIDYSEDRLGASRRTHGWQVNRISKAIDGSPPGPQSSNSLLSAQTGVPLSWALGVLEPET